MQPSKDPPCLEGLPWEPDQPDGGVDIVKPSGGTGTDGQKGGTDEKDEHRVLPKAVMRKTVAAPLVKKTSLPPRYTLTQGKDCSSTTLMLSRIFDHVLPDHVVVDGTYRHWQLNYVVEK